MYNTIILEWKSICEQFINDHQSQHTWTEDKVLLKLWSNNLSTKYLNSTLIEKFIEILPNLTIETKTSVGSVMSCNPAVTIDLLLAYPDLPWFFYQISRLMNINDILNHPLLKWNWCYVSRNRGLTFNIVLSNIDKEWSWFELSCHPNITMSDVESHMDFPWNWDGISYNPNLTMSMIERHPDKNWNWTNISRKMKLTVDILRQNAHKPWSFHHVCSYNYSITLELLLSTPDLPWEYDILSHNECLTMDIVLAFPDKDWNWCHISANNGITMSDSNNGITMSDIESHMDLPWVWGHCMSCNRNIRMCDIEKHHDKPWDWNLIGPIFNPDEYVDRWLCKYSILTMHDEDYDRGEECLDYDNVVDLVIQNIYCMSCILEYL